MLLDCTVILLVDGLTVLRKVEYTPRVSKDLRYRFRVERFGVFKTQDVMFEIEAMMGLDKGEGKEYIDGVLVELDSSAQGGQGQMVPILDLTFGDGIQAWLGGSMSHVSRVSGCTDLLFEVAISMDQLRSLPYNPHWRNEMNLRTSDAFAVGQWYSVEHIF